VASGTGRSQAAASLNVLKPCSYASSLRVTGIWVNNFNWVRSRSVRETCSTDPTYNWNFIFFVSRL